MTRVKDLRLTAYISESQFSRGLYDIKISLPA